MSEEREFSFLNLFKYALRYILIIVLCVMLGVGVGVLGVVKKAPTSYERYTGSLQVNLAAYVALMHYDFSMSEGDVATIATRQVSQILENACSSVVYTKTFNDYAAQLYPDIAKNEDRVDAFYEDFVVYYATDALVVNFYYNIKTEADRELARSVVTTYLKYAKENIELNYPQLAAPVSDAILSVSSVERDLSLPENLRESNATPGLMSSLVSVAIYAVVGGVLGCVVIFAMYFLDPRLKSVKDVFADDAQCDVIDVDREGAITEFLARLKGTNVRRLLLAAPVADARLEGFAEELEAQMKAMGDEATVVRFDATDSAWLTYFDGKEAAAGYEIYLYNDINSNVAFYLDSKVEATAFLVDQSRVKVKKLRVLAQQLNRSRYVCTLLHSKGNVYLD